MVTKSMRIREWLSTRHAPALSTTEGREPELQHGEGVSELNLLAGFRCLPFSRLWLGKEGETLIPSLPLRGASAVSS